MKPLQGIRVLVTRARHQASDLAVRLEALGAIAICCPAIEIEPSPEAERLSSAIAGLSSSDWVVLTSANGVRAAVASLADLVPLQSVSLAAVGAATARELESTVRKPDVVPIRQNSQAIVPLLGSLKGRTVVLPRGDLAGPEMVEDLRREGACVIEVEVYRTVAADWPSTPEAPDAITFSSSSGVLATHERLCEHDRLGWLEEKPIVCIGPVTAATVYDLGYKVAATATEHSIPGLVDALVTYVTSGVSHG